MKIPEDMIAGTIHTTKRSGDLTILDYKSCNNVLVKFLNTGYKKRLIATNIRTGDAKDPFSRNVFGVGFVGDGRYKTKINGKHTKQYLCWHAMISRCYSPRSLSLYHTYNGCSVCNEWHNFQNFAMWFDENFPKDGKEYALDKDIKINGNKVYSPETCLFVTPRENTVKAHAKKYKIKKPDGEVVEIYNMRGFCTENGLDQGAMVKVTQGKLRYYKGWTKA